MLTSIKLKPWIGKDYSSGGIFNKRIMVVCPYLFCDDELNEEEQCVYTSGLVSAYLYQVEKSDGNSMGGFRSFARFEKSLMSMRPNMMQRIAIWNSLLFYSYNQKVVCEMRMRNKPEPNDYAENENAFFETIEQNRPDYIIVWGVRTIELMPANHFRWGESIQKESVVPRFGFYDLDDGTSVKIIPISHPGSFSFKLAENKEILRSLLYGYEEASPVFSEEEVQKRLDESTPKKIDALKGRLKECGYDDAADKLQKIYDWMKNEKRLFIWDEEKCEIKLNAAGKKPAWGYMIAEKLYGEKGFIDITILPKNNFDGFVLSYNGNGVLAKDAVCRYNNRKKGQIVRGQKYEDWYDIIDAAFNEMHISD